MRLLHSVMPELKHAAIITMVPLAAVFVAGCGASGLREAGMTCWTWCCPAPRKLCSLTWRPLRRVRPRRVWRRTEDWEDSILAEMGILEREVETQCWAMISSRGRYAIIEVDLNFDSVGDTLYDENYDDEDFRGYEVWVSRTLDVAVGLVESHGLIVAGPEADVYTVLRNLSNEASTGGSTDIVRSMRRAGDGWYRYGEASCSESLRGCLAVSASFTTGERYEIAFNTVLLFRNERAAESQLEEVEEILESNGDIVVESIVTVDEFLEVRGPH